ncbi:MAG TPA: endolytic transglycosylase MltG [Woeseiaceae bacterium]|nr:endolytic transglycosylase MltG [Woeseiaceae bacterium]
MRPLARALAILVAALVVIGVAAIWQVDRFLDSPVNVPADGARFEIAPGTPFARVSQRLAEEGIVAYPKLLRLYARVSGKANAVHAGEYLIEPGTTTAGLLEQFTRGDVLLYSFTIIEGWNQWDLLRALHAHPEIDAQMSAEDWPALLEELGADTRHPEGLFLPETYHFPRNTSDRTLLRQAYTLMQTVLSEEWPKRDPDAPVSTPYEALILASIVEKETARPDERHRIAGVFARRLEKRMRLQTDPTVIYGIGPDFNGNLTRRDLGTDTPYNTYTRGGLPPTPIAMPGRDAIRAALHPAAGRELYFVATGLGDGSHKFSETKAEHDEAVAEYLKQLRRNRQKGM